jgi:hypothetical protein
MLLGMPCKQFDAPTSKNPEKPYKGNILKEKGRQGFGQGVDLWGWVDF